MSDGTEIRCINRQDHDLMGFGPDLHHGLTSITRPDGTTVDASLIWEDPAPRIARAPQKAIEDAARTAAFDRKMAQYGGPCAVCGRKVTDEERRILVQLEADRTLCEEHWKLR